MEVESDVDLESDIEIDGMDDLDAIDHVLPIGWAYGDRYSLAQWNGPEKYC